MIAVNGVLYARRPPNRLYLMKCGNFTKIGIALDPMIRLFDIDGASPYTVELLFQSDPTRFAREWERYFHLLYADKRRKREWFDLSDDEIREIMEVTHRNKPPDALWNERVQKYISSLIDKPLPLN